MSDEATKQNPDVTSATDEQIYQRVKQMIDDGKIYQLSNLLDTLCRLVMADMGTDSMCISCKDDEDNYKYSTIYVVGQDKTTRYMEALDAVDEQMYAELEDADPDSDD